MSGISASMSMAVDMEGGMASYVGAGGAGAAAGAGSVAASVAAIDGAAIFAEVKKREMYFDDLEEKTK